MTSLDNARLDNASLETGSHAEPGGRAFWLSAVAGAGIVAFGLNGLVTNLRSARVINALGFVAASGVGHDAIWAPLLVLGALATRRVPVIARRPVRVGLAASVVLVLFAVPLLHGYDGRSSNPSAVPLAYGRNTVLTLAAIWLVVGGVCFARTARDRRARL